MIVMEELDIGMVHVVHLGTVLVEDTNTGMNLLSRGTYNPSKQESWDNSIESVSKRFKLDVHKLYLESCALYHSPYLRCMLGNLNQVSTVLQGNCNAGVSTSDEKGFFGLWYFYLNEQGIMNLLSIPQLEKYRYIIDYITNRDRVVTTREGKTILFQKYYSMCEGMPYLDVRGNHNSSRFL